MKKQIQILAATVISIAIVSCSKQGIENPEVTQNTVEEIPASSSSASQRIVIDPLTVNLEGWFAFNGNLKDNTKQLADGVPTTRGVNYASDRKGIAKSAVYFDSTYGIKLKKVPQKTNTSVSVWIKPANFAYQTASYIFGPSSYGPVATQVFSSMAGGVVMNVSTPGGEPYHFSDNNWHHLAITYNGLDVRVYIDGQLQSSKHQTGFIPTSFSDYFLACMPGKLLWKGYLDDLRFYSRTLSEIDIQKLYNQ